MLIKLTYTKQTHPDYEMDVWSNNSNKIIHCMPGEWYQDNDVTLEFELYDIRDEEVWFKQTDDIIIRDDDTYHGDKIVMYFNCDYLSDNLEGIDDFVLVDFSHMNEHVDSYRISKQQFIKFVNIYDTISLVRRYHDIPATYYDWPQDMKMLAKLYLNNNPLD